MRTVCFVQARLHSERLPGKILMDICGKPMLQHVVERAARIPGVDAVYILAGWGSATAIQRVIRHPQTLCWNLPQRDVFGRFHKAIAQTQPDYIVRVTGDCPLLNPEVGGRVVAEAKAHQVYATNDTTISGYPDGYDVQCFPVQTFRQMGMTALSDYDREHVCTWMDEHLPRRLVMAPYVPGPEHPKMSVDTLEDLERVRGILAHEHVKHIH